MKSIHSATIILAIVIFLFNACSTKEHSSVSLPELMQAESIMYEHPDSALRLLQNMKAPSASQKLEHATWALLMTQAKYKMYIKQNDSLANIAYNYFRKQENTQRKALILYLKGGLLYEKKHEEEAQKYFLDAVNIAEKIKDPQLCFLIYSKLGNIYAYSTMKSHALDTFKKAYQNAQKTENKEYIISSLIFLGRAYTVEEDYKYAIDSYIEAIEKAKEINNRKKIMSASNEIAGIYRKLKDYKQALFYIKQAQQIANGDRLQGAIYLSLGEIYRQTNQTDSAYYYLKKVLPLKTYIHTTAEAYLNLYELSKKEQKYAQAISYSDKLIIELDSIHRSDQSKNLAEIQEKYNQQKLINEKKQLKIENDKNTRNALIVLIILICVIAILIYIYQHKLMKKEHIIQKKEEDIRRSMMQINENEIAIKHNLLRMQELNAQIETNRDMQEQMEELSKTYTEIQQQNEALANENQTLQKNIEQYSSTLSTQSEELKKLNELTEENQRLHDRERILSKQLIRNTKVLNDLITAPKYMDVIQWKEIEEAINAIFDNFTERLLKRLPTLTEYEIHLCCLIKLNMNNANMATALGISPASVSKQKYRLKEHIVQQNETFKRNQPIDLWIWDF